MSLGNLGRSKLTTEIRRWRHPTASSVVVILGDPNTQGIPGRPFRMRFENVGSSSASRAR